MTETFLFRAVEQLLAFFDVVSPKLLAHREREGPMRILSVGCASTSTRRRSSARQGRDSDWSLRQTRLVRSGASFIQKPLAPAQLLDQIRLLLGGQETV